MHLASTGSLGTDIGLVALGILDIVLRLAGFAASIYIIYGGIQYITSQGEADKTKHALQTIVNAFVGLVISIVAASVVRSSNAPFWSAVLVGLHNAGT